MNKAFVAISTAAALFFGAASAQATSTVGTISTLQIGGDGTFSFALTNSPNLCSNGNKTNQRGAVVPGIASVTADGAKMLYATLVSAYTTGRTITVYTNETVTTTGWGCTVYALDLDN